MQQRETAIGVLDKVRAILLAFSREESMLTRRTDVSRQSVFLPYALIMDADKIGMFLNTN